MEKGGGSMKIASVMVMFAALVPAVVPAQGWSPQKNVEIVVGSAPGGSNDTTARTLESILTARKLVPTAISVVNRAGAGGSLAYSYVSQRTGDAHSVVIASSVFLTNNINGASNLSIADFTPLAMLCEDHAVFMVSNGSPFKSGKDLAAALVKDSKSVSVGFTAFGGSRHLAGALLVKALGGNARDMKPVVFKGSSEAITAVLGGHIDVAIAGAGNAVQHVAAGRMRVVAVAAPKRLSGALSSAPTWREQGLDVVYGNWRSVFAPKGLTPAQIAFWENALRRLSESPEWRADVDKNYLTENFLTGTALQKELEQEYSWLKTTLVDLGLAKN
jgi:putative tricarboxylic transport membrane protein